MPTLNLVYMHACMCTKNPRSGNITQDDIRFLPGLNANWSTFMLLTYHYLDYLWHNENTSRNSNSLSRASCKYRLRWHWHPMDGVSPVLPWSEGYLILSASSATTSCKYINIGCVSGNSMLWLVMLGYYGVLHDMLHSTGNGTFGWFYALTKDGWERRSPECVTVKSITGLSSNPAMDDPQLPLPTWNQSEPRWGILCF